MVSSISTRKKLIIFSLGQFLEQEASAGNPEAIAEIRKEISHLRVRSEALESDVKQKDKEIEVLKQRLEDQSNIYSTSLKVEDKLKVAIELMT